MKKLLLATLPFISLSASALTYEAKVTEILQHDSHIAVYLNPDPGKAFCDVGQPYLLPVTDTVEHQQKYTLLLTALTTGKTIKGYLSEGECDSNVWGQSRPIVRRIAIKAD